MYDQRSFQYPGHCNQIVRTVKRLAAGVTAARRAQSHARPWQKVLMTATMTSMPTIEVAPPQGLFSPVPPLGDH